MAILKMKKIKEMKNDELDSRLVELKLELSRDRASSEVGTLKNPGAIAEIRRAVARILTEKRFREKKEVNK